VTTLQDAVAEVGVALLQPEGKVDAGNTCTNYDDVEINLFRFLGHDESAEWDRAKKKKKKRKSV
jgi:hypothetical protein